jgi:mono/diheme cytochrome c family protein
MTPDVNQQAPTEPLSRTEDDRNDVAAIHAPILSREKAEPQEGLEPAPFWFITMIGALLFWGGYYLGHFNGGFKALVFDEKASGLPVVASAGPPGEVDMVVLGKRTFTAMCAPCHQETGLGLPNQFPPLAGSDWVNATGHARIVRIVLDGFTGPVNVNGQPFNGTMVPWREAMNDEQIAAVLTYVRQAWGNKGAPVTVVDVKTLRERTKERAGQPWTDELLKAVPEKE